MSEKIYKPTDFTPEPSDGFFFIERYLFQLQKYHGTDGSGANSCGLYFFPQMFGPGVHPGQYKSRFGHRY